jgi:hypothetical protein
MAFVFEQSKAPVNLSADYCYTVLGNHNCGGTVQQFRVGGPAITSPGRYVLLRSLAGITGYVGSTFAWSGASSRLFRGIAREYISFDGVAWDCIVADFI